MKEFLLQNIDLISYIGIGFAVLVLAVFILIIVILVKLKKFDRRLKDFMRGKDAQSLEESIVEHFKEIDIVREETEKVKKEIENIKGNLLITYQKVGIVKYDAFNEMGGKLSFSLAVLDKKNNGFVLNAMHSREGCYTYIKEIIDGNSYIALGEEEKKALEMALNSKGLGN